MNTTSFKEVEIQAKGEEKLSGYFSTWWLVPDGSDYIIIGCINGSVKTKNGKIFHTSRIVELDRKNGLVRTQNSLYALGIELDPKTWRPKK